MVMLLVSRIKVFTSAMLKLSCSEAADQPGASQAQNDVGNQRAAESRDLG